jgi:hypothetical protein
MGYILEKKLKQHTYLIHFQHDKDATIRASEVKPKLDRFLIQKLKKLEYEKLKELEYDLERWTIKGQDERGNSELVHALSYKMSFILNEKEKKVNESFHDKSHFPCFFGNSGKNNSDKYYASFAKEALEMRIICRNDKLKTFIDENLNEFFNKHTFGTRQSKGFGVFSIVDELHPTAVPNRVGQYFFDVKLKVEENDYNTQERIFRHIDLFWRLLRSGLNDKGGYQEVGKKDQLPILDLKDVYYCKPVLFSYLKDKGIQWDKKTLKEHFLSKEDIKILSNSKMDDLLRIKKHQQVFVPGLDSQKISRKDSEALHYEKGPPHYLWRDLFGLSASEQWGSYGFSITKNHQAANQGDNKDDDLNIITRFQSPIRFHPIISNENQEKICRVWFTCCDIPRVYLDASFIIKSSNDVRPIKLSVGQQLDKVEIKNLTPIIEWLIIQIGQIKSINSDKTNLYNWTWEKLLIDDELGKGNTNKDYLYNILKTLQKVTP